MAILTALTPLLGYERAAELVRLAVETGITARETLTTSGEFTAGELEDILRVEKLTRPGVIKR